MNDSQPTHIEKPIQDLAPRWSFDQDRQHVVARLESFTDIVFGFAIFTLAMNLKVPVDAKDLVNQRFEFAIFFINFVFITSLWWQHHRIFAFFFKPTFPAIVIHFAFLACTAMLSYPLQLYIQNHKSLVVIQTYLAAFALVYFLQTLLIFLGRQALRVELGPEHYARGAVFGSISGSLCAISLLSLSLTYVIGSLGGAAMSVIPLAVFVVRKLAKTWVKSFTASPAKESENPEIAAYDVP